jgi:ABC-type branched-subunit amino acid transport system substrate-binding protein
MPRSPRLLWFLALIALLAACGSERGASTTSTAAPDDTTDQTDGTTEDSTAPDVPMFGDMAWPCGPGDAAGASAQGVTDDAITIGVGDDRGFASAPGLNKEATDALLAVIDACNELGGINGRQVEPIVYDAAIGNIATKMAEACQQVFMLVGQGWALDDQGEQTRVGCGLASIPGFTVSAVAAHGPRVVQPVPNPADQYNAAPAYQLAELFPDETKKAAVMFGNFAATQETKEKFVIAGEQAGWTFVSEQEFSIGGEADWTPFVLELQRTGAEVVVYIGSCENYQPFRRTAANNGFEAIYVAQPNFYSGTCKTLDADGSLDGTYVPLAYVPTEEAAESAATQAFTDIAEAAGVEPSLLGMQSTTAFLLWATAAQACGADLTPDCVLQEAGAIDGWTAGGLHAPQNPGALEAGDCSLLLVLEGGTYTRAHPDAVGEFDCDDSYRIDVQTAALTAAKLDEDRISTVYTG